MLLSTDPSPWLAVFGRFHIVLLHLPIGLLPGIAVLEFGAALLKKSSPRGAIGTLAVMTALAAGAAFASGLVLAEEKVQSDLLANHRYTAMAMTALCALLPVVAFRQRRRPFRLLLCGALAMSMVAGHFGGSLTHKQDFLFKPLATRAVGEAEPQAQVPGEPPPNAAPVSAAPETTTAGGAAEGAADYRRDILPILERVCIDCHNAEKEKGDLLLTGTAWIDRTGDDVVVVAGQPDNSVLIELVELPLDDEDHMPPADEPQPTERELALLRRWVAEGAKH